jgi:hypothetical protein
MLTLLRAAVAAAVLIAAILPLQAAKGEPGVVKVQHILIGFKKSIPGKELERTRGQAKTLAGELLDRAQAGEDFDALVKQYTDEQHPGIYVLSNDGVPKPAGGHARKDMALRFGDVAFKLEVGEVGLAAHHATLCPFGYHVIKRLPLDEEKPAGGS